MKDRSSFSLSDHSYQLLLLAVLAVTVCMLGLGSPFFFQWDNLRNILDQSTLNIIMAVGMTFVIGSSGIDLSVGASAALSGIICAILMKAGTEVCFAVFASLAAGVLLGIANGTFIHCFGISPFIVTLGSMSVFRGLALIITGAIPIYGFPAKFTWLGRGALLSLPVSVVVCAVILVISRVLLKNTGFGLYTLAMGSNEEALRRVGVGVGRYKIAVYGFCGLTAAISGIFLTARLNCAEPLAGYMMGLDAIATVILGGTSMKGGNASMGGTLTAGILLAILRNGLTILGVASYYQQFVVGLIILVAAVVAELRSKILIDKK